MRPKLFYDFLNTIPYVYLFTGLVLLSEEEKEPAISVSDLLKRYASLYDRD